MSNRSKGALPLLLQHGKKLEPQAIPRTRQDCVRQVSQVQIDGVWVDAVDAKVSVEAGTSVTDVKRETTDDH